MGNKKARFGLDSLSFAYVPCALYPKRGGKDGRLMSGRITAERTWPIRKDCLSCGKPQKLISQALGVCVDCLRINPDRVASHIESVHELTRQTFSLPPSPPQHAAGTLCNFCIRACRIPDGQPGFCAIRRNQGGKIVGGKEEGNADWYYDPLPTNCVADWVCPAGTGSGYPKFDHTPGPEYGYKNLAVFYNACTFDCLFCQNWHYRLCAREQRRLSAPVLADRVDDPTSCICYFGGDPTPQLMHAIAAVRLVLKKRRGGILRICWETNGAMHAALLKQMTELSLISGGCVKFDLKAWNDGVHRPLCEVTNRRTLDNFSWLAREGRTRPGPLLVVASTLLVPGYVDVEEVRRIAEWMAGLDPGIPYTLLAFHPNFHIDDLPTTSRSLALERFEAARETGLKRVRLGNRRLISANA